MRRIIKILLLVSLAIPAGAQVSDSTQIKKCARPRFHPSLSIGTMAGGQVNSGGFYYKSGMALHVSARVDLNNWLSAGIGTGIEKLQQEWMYPLFTEIVSSFSSTPGSGFFILQTGYAFSYLEAYEAFEGYEGNGGFMISPGWGYRIALNDNVRLLFMAQFRQQSFNVRYTTDAGVNYHDRFSYSLIMLKAGLSF